VGSSASSSPTPPPYTVPRKHPRIPLTIEIRCDGSGRAERFISRDISTGGVFLYTTRVYPLDVKVELGFYLPYHHEQVSVVGYVRRHSQDPQSGLVDGMGIEFENVPEAVQKSLENYIDRTKR